MEHSDKKNEGQRISEVAQELHDEGILKGPEHKMQEMLSSIKRGITLLYTPDLIVVLYLNKLLLSFMSLQLIHYLKESSRH